MGDVPAMVHFDPGRILGQQPETPCSVPREHGKSRRAGFPSGKHIRGSRSERFGQLRQRLFVRHSQVMQFDPGHQLIRIVTVGNKSEILFYALDIRDISHGIQLFGDQTRRGDMRQRLQLLVSAGHKNFTDYRNAAFAQSCTVFLNQTSTGRLSCTSAMLECRNIPKFRVGSDGMQA